jgi:hypothetical protein
MVIIGVRMRVSGGGYGGNTEGVVEKDRGLWRTCGSTELLREWKGFGRGDVEIFCSTWNIFYGVTVIKRIKAEKQMPERPRIARSGADLKTTKDG